MIFLLSDIAIVLWGTVINMSLCPDTIMGRHGPADKYGRCPWCHTKYEASIRKPPLENVLAECDSAYGYYYDPDFGTNNIDEY